MDWNWKDDVLFLAGYFLLVALGIVALMFFIGLTRLP